MHRRPIIITTLSAYLTIASSVAFAATPLHAKKHHTQVHVGHHHHARHKPLAPQSAPVLPAVAEPSIPPEEPPLENTPAEIAELEAFEREYDSAEQLPSTPPSAQLEREAETVQD